MVHFAPESLAQFAPDLVAQFDRNIHEKRKITKFIPHFSINWLIRMQELELEILSEMIRKVRLERNLSPEELEKLIGIHP